MRFQKWLIFIFVFTYPFLSINGQNTLTPIQAFKFQKIGGEIGLDGYYNYKLWDRLGIEDNYKISYISPAISLNTKSYIWHPNLLSINFKADYNPELRQNIADIHPDRVERMSRKGIDLSTILLKNKNYRISSQIKLSDGYYNNEDISYSKSNSSFWDVKLSGMDKKIPFVLSYSNLKSETENITNNRIYSFDTKRLIGRISKTFFKNDAHYIQYKYTEDNRLYNSLANINTRYHEINLNNRLYFDKKNNYLFNSTIREYIKYGNQESKEFSATEKFLFKFPANFRLGLNYNFRNYLNEDIKLNQNDIFAHLDHKLFQSLRSSVFYSINDTKQSLYNQQIKQAGFSFNYLKKIPTGNIVINYYFANEQMDHKNKSGIIQVVNEQHTITDGDILLLNNPFVNKQSVVVKSMNQILIYQENLDYYLVDQGNYIEIQRIPGGQLNNNSIIYIDYTAEQAGTSSYSLNRHNFSAEISVLKKLVSVYYRYKEDAYSDIEFENIFSRDEYKQHIMGIKSHSKYYNAGIEYKKKVSSLIPIQQLRYYANMKLRHKKFQFFASASNNYYYKYGVYSNQSYFYSSANVTYRMRSNTIIQYSFDYRNQNGDNIFLNLVKSKLEYSSRIRALSYSFGLEYFHRNRLLEEEMLGGVFVKVKRRF
ncbi:MAG: hypothetical protein KOO66_14000 [Bacteroidales bacterium]|nr:hypothetical protein [Bacteroidales bacterium]